MDATRQMLTAFENAWIDRALSVKRTGPAAVRGIDAPIRTLSQAAREVYYERAKRTLEQLQWDAWLDGFMSDEWSTTNV